MSVILAEDIGGWLAAGTLVVAGVVSSVLAVLALIPASRGNRATAILLGAPALLTVSAITAWIVVDTVRTRNQGGPRGSLSDTLVPWVIFAGLPLLTGGLAVLVIWAKGSSRP